MHRHLFYRLFLWKNVLTILMVTSEFSVKNWVNVIVKFLIKKFFPSKKQQCYSLKIFDENVEEMFFEIEAANIFCQLTNLATTFPDFGINLVLKNLKFADARKLILWITALLQEWRKKIFTILGNTAWEIVSNAVLKSVFPNRKIFPLKKARLSY